MMVRLTERIEKYIEAYQSAPFGREVEGTVELLQEISNKLAEYERLEEQGLLLRLPCKVGDTVYRIMPHDNYIMESTVGEFVFTDIVYVIVRDELFNLRKGLSYDEKGITWFLNKEEAENKLKEIKEF